MADLKVVKLTDGTEADFPINTSLSEIDKKLAVDGLFRDVKVKPYLDRGFVDYTDSTVAKTAKPVVEGAAGILGLPGDIQRNLNLGADTIAKLLGASPEQIASARASLDISGQVRKLIGAENVPSFNFPTSGEIVELAKEAGIPMQQAESFPGRVAQNIVRNVVSAPVRSAVVPSIISAAGEETAAVPFRGTPLEPYARLVGGIGAPLATIPMMTKSPLERMYAETTKRLTPQELEAASQLQKQSFAANMPVTSFEAMQQAAGGRTNLPAIQRQIEGTPASAPAMAEFIGQRGAQTLQTLEEQFPQIARPQIGGAVQQAAQAEQRVLSRQVTAEAGPAFEAIKAKRIPQSWMTNLEKESAVIAEAGKAVDNIPVYQDLLKGYDKNSIARIESMRQYLSDKYDNLSAINQGKVTGEMKAYQAAKEKLLNKADIQIPEYKDARLQYQEVRNRIEGPIRETPIPELAKTNEIAVQFGELFSKNPAKLNITPAKVEMTIKALGKQDAMLPKEFLTQYMRSSLEEVNRAASRKEGTIGARFVDTIAKNTTQRANLQTAFTEVYGNSGKQAAIGLNTMLNILEAQGRRLPAGSPTAEKGMMAEQTISLLGKTLTNPVATVGNLYQTIFYGRDYNKLAQAITSPDGVMALENIAKASKDRKKLGLALVEIQQVIKATETEPK